MNTPLENLPESCDVLVVGAGPAGSAAAITLARAGLDVVLVDQQSFPRDKICGDGLIPDAHRALAELGVLAEVMAVAQPAHFVRCTSPRGRQLDVPGTLAVLPRRQLDEIICRAAVRAGAEGVLLDDFAPSALAELVPRLRALAAERGAPVVLEASGIAPAALRAYATAGIDLISSSAPITRSPWLDLSMRFDPAPRGGAG